MIEALLGTTLGGMFRLAPEVIRLLDRKDERKHELAMLDKNFEIDKLRAQTTHYELDSQIGVAEIQALIEATKAQGTKTGIKWVDGFNACIRPILALQWLIILWPSIIVAGFISSIQIGTDPLEALKTVFGVDEKAMACSIASFWLVDRSLRKMGK